MWRWFSQLNLVQRYSLAALLVTLLAMVILAWWVGREIEANVISRVSGDSALFVENFVVVPLQELATQDFVSPKNLETIDTLLSESTLGSEFVAFKIWAPGGKVVFGDTQGQTFPVTDDQAHAWNGKVWAEISDLGDSENLNLKGRFASLLEMYIPIRLAGSNKVIAVVEFYQTVDALQKNVRKAQRQSWLVVALVMLSLYALLVGIVRQGHGTIVKQQQELNQQVKTLNELLRQNEELDERVRRAALRTAALNERFLRRVSAELHDGPAQDLSFSLLHLDALVSSLESSGKKNLGIIDSIQQSLSRATQEIRNIATGLRLPELEPLTLCETLERVVRDHERRTQSRVEVTTEGLPKQASLPIKVTLFRVVQEALSNAYRHGQGQAQKVSLRKDNFSLVVAVSDEGPGFDTAQQQSGTHLGLMGMRERLESVGGTFKVESRLEHGTILTATLPLSEGLYE
jgi:signal transduction histidine kinase